jgi:hypothetical protein
MNYGNRVYPTVASTANRVIEIEEGMFKRWEEGRMGDNQTFAETQKGQDARGTPTFSPNVGQARCTQIYSVNLTIPWQSRER